METDQRIALLSVEGEGVSIFGREEPGGWSFWSVYNCVWDEEDLPEGAARPGQILKRGTDLAEVIPAEWPMYFPWAIDPQFVGWFRSRYEEARSALPASTPLYTNVIAPRLDGKWHAALGIRDAEQSVTPDRGGM